MPVVDLLPSLSGTGLRGPGTTPTRRRGRGQTHGVTDTRSDTDTRGRARPPTDLPLLLLPGGVQQQVAVPLLLLDHVLIFVVHVVVLHAGLDLVHGAGCWGLDGGLGLTSGRRETRRRGGARARAETRLLWAAGRALSREEAPARAQSWSAQLNTCAPSRGRAPRPRHARSRPGHARATPTPLEAGAGAGVQGRAGS